jgi:hypothetical protein
MAARWGFFPPVEMAAATLFLRSFFTACDKDTPEYCFFHYGVEVTD